MHEPNGPFLHFFGKGGGDAKKVGFYYSCARSSKPSPWKIVYDLSTTEFLLAFKRFVARRGEPKTYLSDNGTNFRGTAREISDYWKKMDQTKIQSNHPHIQFKFIPPASPHHGGVCERMVGTVKRALKGVLPSALQHHPKARGEE